MEGGGSLREHLESNARQGDVEDRWRLENPPPLPAGAAHVWAWFVDLHATRATNGMGPCRLSRLEIQAWERDQGVNLMAWERRAIIAVDGAWVASTVKPEV